MNSISACISEDIKHRFFGKGADKSEVNFARLVIVVAGLLSYGISIYLIRRFKQFMGFILINHWIIWCTISGIFAVGIFTKRANTFGVLVGLVAGVIIAYVLNGVGGGNAPFYVSIISFVVAFIFGYLVSLVVPSKNAKDITGLTIFDKDKPSTYISKVVEKNNILLRVEHKFLFDSHFISLELC